jgi:signal transduction histidine kinase/CheY-like chemotaxis protein
LVPQLQGRAYAVVAQSGADRDAALAQFDVAQKRFGDVAHTLQDQRLMNLTVLWRISAGALAFAAFSGLLLAVGLAVVAHRYVAHRIERVAHRASAFAQGEDVADMPLVGGDDDVSRLDEVLLDMADTIVSRETELRAALKDAQAASLAKSTFVATMSHEMRTPLNGVIGMTDLLLESPLNEQQREFAKTIQTSSNLLLGVINDVLDFSRISSGNLVLERAAFSLEPVLRSVIAICSAQVLLKDAPIALTLNIATDVPACVWGDQLRLRQILLNLIGNAVKFTDTGKVTVSVTAARPSPGSALVTFSIADTGIGISDSMLQTLFEPFQQADMSNTRRFGGSGLGLSISRQLAIAMGGRIDVTSTPGHGSEFHLTVTFDEAAATDVAPAKGVAADSQQDERRSGRRERILVAEDNEINQRVAIRLLQRLGFEPDIAPNGAEAVAAVARKPYDLILMDIQMPEMNGLEASQELRRRESENGSRIPIVAMTANVLPEDREACRSAGMDDYVSKPVSLKELKRVVDRWLSPSFRSRNIE